MTFKELLNEHKELLTNEILENGCIFRIFENNIEYTAEQYDSIIDVFEQHSILFDSMCYDSVDLIADSIKQHADIFKEIDNRIADILYSQNFDADIMNVKDVYKDCEDYKYYKYDYKVIVYTIRL